MLCVSQIPALCGMITAVTGSVYLSPELPAKFKDQQQTWLLPFNSLMAAPCCYFDEPWVLVEVPSTLKKGESPLHDHLKEYTEGDQFDFEAALQHVSRLLKPCCLSHSLPFQLVFSCCLTNWFSTLMEVVKTKQTSNTDHYKLRFISEESSSARQEARKACEILSGLDDKCLLRLTLLVAPKDLSDKHESDGTALAELQASQIQDFEANVQKLVNEFESSVDPKYAADIKYAATVSVDPQHNDIKVPLARIGCDHRDFEKMKKQVDDSSNLRSVVLH